MYRHLVFLVGVAMLCVPAHSSLSSKLPLGFKPNILFILTDDQDRMLGKDDFTAKGSVDVMPNLQSQLIQKGAWFENFFVNTPICCPSRTEFLTGRYFHNLKGDKLSDMSYDAELTAEGSGNVCMHADTTKVSTREDGMFGLLTAAGYNTGLFGKTTNNQQWMLDQLVANDAVKYIDSPLKYNDFECTTYYQYGGNGTSTIDTLDRTKPKYGTTYQTAQIGNRTLDWLKHASRDFKANGDPFFAYLGFHAPHYPAQPAPWHQDLMKDLTIPITENYNVSCPDKAQHIRQNPGLSERVHCWQNVHFRDRWLSLLSVDDTVSAVLSHLEEEQILDQTFIVYTSDHGYKMGQWRIGVSKQHPYETDIRVPFIVRGPGVEPGSQIDQITGNIDLLPTFLELAGATVPDSVDGRSFLPLLMPKVAARSMGHQAWRDRWLNEYFSVGTYWFDHSTPWDGNGYGRSMCGRGLPDSPQGKIDHRLCKESDGVGDGNCYMVDSTHSNSWRSLRILNSTHNLAYIEYDPDWEFAEGQQLQHIELYDVTKDPHQLHNVYGESSKELTDALHAEMVEYFACAGPNCPPAVASVGNVLVI